MTTPARLIDPGGCAVLCVNPHIQTLIDRVIGRDCVVVDDAGQLAVVLKQYSPCVVVVDREHIDADTALKYLATAATSTILLLHNTIEDPPSGAQIVVFESALGHALKLVTRPGGLTPSPPPRLDVLLPVSVLSGPLDEALETAADQVAHGFGVDRCVISVRGDATGAGGRRTVNAMDWNRTTERCRMALASSATLLAMTETEVETCESYLAVPLDTPLGSHGFLGLVATTPRVFTLGDRTMLQAVASRLGAELGWRGVHERTADELARLASGPGLDPHLGIWNQVAMTQLMATLASAALRSKQPLTALVLDVVDLRSINTRYGLKTGDLMLRRIADAVRANVRIEDLVGRWSGDKTVVILQHTTFEAAQQVAEALHRALAARMIELLSGERIAIPVTLGIAALQPNEEPSHMVARAATAANQAPAEGRTVAGSMPGSPTPLPITIEHVDEPPITIAGTYRLRHEISRGGMGVVYRADDLALERSVAIKMLRPDLVEDREFIEYLRAEAAALARIQHPNLVQIYHFGQAGGDAYFVMELVEGEGLQEAIDRHLREGTAPALAVNVSVIEEVASALDALHECGIIHRDVKPANVIRDPFRGRGVLVDVGIAHRAGQVAVTAGTPGYMAPEVSTGGPATARSDVYGLAATAYAILTLVEPFGDGAGSEVLARQHKGEPPARPSSHVAELAPADHVLLQGLDRDPALRHASAGEFSRALSRALSIVAPSPRPMRRREDDRAFRQEIAEPRPQTRGLVFRSLTRVLGVHEAARLRDVLGGEDPELARALTDTAPMAWLPTELFTRLLAGAPRHLDLDGSRLARDVARASVRATFRRFFPSSIATLMPERTMSAIRNVWGRYQSWGTITSMPILATESLVRMTGTPRNGELCAWTGGMLEQLVVLSGGRTPTVAHDACEALGHDACMFRVQWE